MYQRFVPLIVSCYFQTKQSNNIFFLRTDRQTDRLPGFTYKSHSMDEDKVMMYSLTNSSSNRELLGLIANTKANTSM